MKSDAQPKPALIPGAKHIRHLGSGGFADVFLYQQETPRRRVAVKIQRLGATTELDNAFRAEVDLLAHLSSHPAIVSVYDAGVTADGRQYMMMEYCPPPNVSGRLRMQEYSVEDVLDMGIRLAGALASLHAVGILHRDVKPANILLTEFGHPVLTDFGLAASMTNTKLRAGRGFSVPWAPPEQHNANEPYGVTGDIYSLAATLYTMLAGRSPFEISGGDNSELTMIARVLKTPLPPTGRSDVPKRLERVLAHGMEKEPTDRYQTAIEFAQALQQIQTELHQRMTPVDLLSEEYTSEYTDELQSVETRHAMAILLAQAEAANDGKTVARMIDPVDAQRAAARGESDCDCPRCTIDPMSLTPSPADKTKPWLVAALVTGIVILLLWTWKSIPEVPQFQPVEPVEVVQDLTPMKQAGGIKNLSGVRTARGVRFMWTSEVEGATFLYRVLDPLDRTEVLKTTDPFVEVPAQPGQTCIEVLIRFKDGTQSAAETSCVPTP